MRDIIIALPVWGDRYLEGFLNLTAPALLAPSNLPELARHLRVQARVYTRRDDSQRLMRHTNIRRLAELGSVTIVPIDSFLSRDSKFDILTLCHLEALYQAECADAPAILYGADAIYSDGTFARIWDCINAGKRGFLTYGARARSEGLSDALTPFHLKSGDGESTLAVPPGALVRIWFDHMHEQAKRTFWPGPFNPFPDTPNIFQIAASLFHFKVDEHTILARLFSQHPLMIYPTRKAVRTGNTTVDMNWIYRWVDRYEDLHIVKDSDEAFGIDYAPAAIGDQNTPNQLLSKDPPDFFGLGVWWNQYQDPFHTLFAETAIRIHDGPTDPLAWRDVEAESLKVIQTIRVAAAEVVLAKELIRTRPGVLVSALHQNHTEV